MRRAYCAEKSGDWEGYKVTHRDKREKSEWAFSKVKESYDKVAMEDAGGLSIAQDILRESTDFLRRIIVPAPASRGVTLSRVCPHCRCLPLEDYLWWVSSGHGKKQCGWWCAACGGQYDWRAPNRILVIQAGVDPREAKVFRAHCAPEGLCDHLLTVLKLLSNEQKDGDGPVESIVTVLREKSRKGGMDGLRKFIEVDNREAVIVGGLR